ncbi:hypothetical protein MHYP_G00343100 [Metynnis hypsauchen]
MRSTFDLRRNPDPHGRSSASSMSECGVQVIQSGTMSKVTAKKRNVEEDEEQLPMFDKSADEAGHLDDSDEGNEDLSDSEESVFSGLEDSGSDDDDDDGDDDEEEEVCDDDEVATDSMKEETNVNEKAESIKKTSETSFKPQAEDKTAKVTKLRKKKNVPEEGEGVEKSGKSGTNSGLKLSSQVDEYEQDTSDEEAQNHSKLFENQKLP